MKKHAAIILLLSLIFLFASCNVKETADIESLKAKYPEYFEMSDFKGIEVYVWQDENGSFLCGMMSGTNRNKSYEEIAALRQRALTVDETKLILSELGIEEDKVCILPVVLSDAEEKYVFDFDKMQKILNLFGK
ncbi:MAG: hypothetical protein KBS59_05420 [Clostridiales bacterium]|nr:hypothetical protein [Clostridiales bacterium]